MTYDVNELIEGGSIFVINHSGGKDSQAMYLYLTRELNIPSDQIRVVHAHLHEMEWDGIQDHIRDTIDHELHVVSKQKDGQDYSLLDMVAERGMFPGKGMKQRWCTGTFKRDVIQPMITKWKYESANGITVNCMGLRSEESDERAKRPEWSLNKGTNKSVTVVDWSPIKEWKETLVYGYIASHGQEPHWVYAQGMDRCSCKICIYSSPDDVALASILEPDFFQKIVDLEQQTGFTMFTEKRDPIDVSSYAAKSGFWLAEAS